tara:strand:+ start:642 stop:914 length:273 start_codon:yes stop_codon:yes gene_type:complete
MPLKKSSPPKKAIMPITTAICIKAFLNVGFIIDIKPISASGTPMKAGIIEVIEELPEINDIEKPQMTINRPYSIVKSSMDKDKTLKSSVL